MLWIKTVFGRRDTPASRRHLGQVFAVGAAVVANLPVPAFAADLTAPPPAFIRTGLCIGANAGAWFAPANPSNEAIGVPSAGFDLVPNGGGDSAGLFTGGFQAGCIYQIGSLVPGFETDFNYFVNCGNGTFAARYFLRQTIGHGGGTEQIEAGANQLAGPAA